MSRHTVQRDDDDDDDGCDGDGGGDVDADEGPLPPPAPGQCVSPLLPGRFASSGEAVDRDSRRECGRDTAWRIA